ncbi:hypothetical protein CDAR_271411 [Caerostris darwini]|uniref:Uncharacterized protein n=1 Tax=Caerostris darwini TaxID=1538125 RepID=A0AAV4TNX1_9ARAC|nr:hypothetical protein CDAR_271411 [Caerostris darwini]
MVPQKMRAKFTLATNHRPRHMRSKIKSNRLYEPSKVSSIKLDLVVGSTSCALTTVRRRFRNLEEENSITSDDESCSH